MSPPGKDISLLKEMLMNSYITIFDPVPWKEIGITFIQTVIIYWLVLLGLKLLGRRALGQLGPQELILLLIISESTDLGISHGEAGFWGSISSIIALLLTVFIVERIPFLNKAVEGKPVAIAQNGEIIEAAMKKYRIDPDEIEKVARIYGVSNIHDFECLTLEGDGRITGILKVNMQTSQSHKQSL